MLTLEQKKEKLRLLRKKRILKCRSNFWDFQKNNAPDDFKDERTYLICLSLCLQSFYEDRPISYLANHPIEHHEKLDLSATTIPILFEEKGEKTLFTVDCSGIDILLIEVPRRHHKSHTLINFECWMFGQDPMNIVVTAAHNAALANEFSQYVRDGIEEQRLKAFNIIYSDIFPKTRTKHGDRSKTRWSLDCNYLSYAGSGILFPPTGKGGSLGVFDDPIRGPKEAFNEDHRSKVWTAYSTGWLPVLEGDKKHIFVMTPWCEEDPGDRIIKDEDGTGQKVGIFNCTCYTPEQGMLCEEILDKRAYDILEKRMDPVIFSGNFKSKRIPMAGRLYTKFNRYTVDDLPENFDELFCYIDTADQGTDYLAAVVVGIVRGKDEFGLPIKKAYVLDIYYTKDGMEITEPETARFLIKNHIQKGMKVMIESNAGGRGFARSVERILREKYQAESKGIFIEWFHQSSNKVARINTESHIIMNYFYFPADAQSRNKYWYDAMEHLRKYSKEGKNENDDIEDCLTGISEHKVNTELTMLDALRLRKLMN